MAMTIVEGGGEKRVYPAVTRFECSLTAARTVDQRLVAVWFDGEPEFYVIDGAVGLEQLEQYYRRDWGDSYDGHVSSIQIFRLVGSVFSSRPEAVPTPWWTDYCAKPIAR